MASIKQRYHPDDGRLLGYQVRIDRKVRGEKPIHLSKLCATKAEADKWATIKESEIHREVYQDKTEIQKLTLDEALKEYKRKVTPKKKRPKEEEGLIERLRKHDLAYRSIASLKPKDFADYRDERLKAGKSGNTVRIELAVFSNLFTVGIQEWGWPCEHPIINKVAAPKLAKGRDRRLSLEKNGQGMTEEEMLFSEIDNSLSPLLKPVTVLGLDTGMRLGEILSLRWEWINLKTAIARLPDTKNGTARDVPLSTRAVATLKALMPEAAADNVERLTPPTGQIFVVGQKSIQHSFARACDRAGIADLHFHDLRHEATSRLFERGFSIQEVALIIGHKTLAMLKRYTHLRATDLVARLG